MNTNNDEFMSWEEIINGTYGYVGSGKAGVLHECICNVLEGGCPKM